MSKQKKDDELNRITGERLKPEIKRVYKDSKRPLWDFYMDVNDSYGYYDGEEKGFISYRLLSSIQNGRDTLTRNKAEAFAEVLGVYPEYLLGYVPYRNEAEKKTHELSERSSRMQNHICEIESPDGAMRESIRSFFRLLTLSDYEYHPRMVNSKEFQSYSYEPDDPDFFKACQLEVGSMSDPSFFEDMNLFNIYIVSIDIDGTEYSLINGEFKKLVYSTIEAVKQTVNNALTFASIHNASASDSASI